MGWEPSVRKHVKRGRRPYYTIEVRGKEHHLGSDKAKAYAKAGDILDRVGVPAAEPENVSGLFLAYTRSTGRTPQGCMRFIEWAKPGRQESRSLTSLEPKDLQRFADWLKTQTTKPREMKPAAQAQEGEPPPKPRKPKPVHPLSAWSVRHYVADARKMWAWGASQGWPICEPGKARTATPVLQPRDEKPEAVQAAIHKLNPRAAAIVKFICSTGCRPSEARHLLWDHVDLAASVAILHGKTTARTGRPRTIHLPPAVKRLLKAQPRIGDHVFNTIRKGPWTKDGLHTVLDRAGIRSSYSLRHTFAQWFLDHGGEKGGPGDKAELQAWLGHADGRMTDVYAQVRDRRLQQVAKRIRGPLAK